MSIMRIMWSTGKGSRIQALFPPENVKWTFLAMSTHFFSMTGENYSLPVLQFFYIADFNIVCVGCYRMIFPNTCSSTVKGQQRHTIKTCNHALLLILLTIGKVKCQILKTYDAGIWIWTLCMLSSFVIRSRYTLVFMVVANDYCRSTKIQH